MTTDLTQGNLMRHIKTIAIPASTGMIFNTLYNVVDTYYSGKIGTDAMAGLSISFPIFFIIIALSTGVGSGTTALSSIAIGKKDYKLFHIYIRNSLYLGVSMAILLLIIAPSISTFLFRLSGASGPSLLEGTNYMNTLIWGAFFFILNSLFNAILSAQGDTKSYRNALIMGFLLNVALDPMFIYGWAFIPKLGTTGIALATVIVQIITSLYLLYRIFRSPLFNLTLLKASRYDPKALKALIKQGVPASLNMSTIALGVFIVNYFILTFSDAITIAAYGAAMRIEQLALLPALGLNTAAVTITGQNFGAEAYKRIFKVQRLTLIIGVSIMILGAIIIYPLAPLLISLFNPDKAVIAAGTTYLRIEVFAFPTYVILGILLSVLQGIKKPGFAVYIGLYRQIIMPIPLFYFFGQTLNMGVSGIWWGIVFLTWTSVLATYLYNHVQLKKMIEIT